MKTILSKCIKNLVPVIFYTSLSGNLIATEYCGSLIKEFSFSPTCELSKKSTPKTNFVTIVKQWHPGPTIDTTNISESKRLPTYQNQIEIFENMNKYLKLFKANIVLVEGCEGEINSRFSDEFYGWSMKKLKEMRSSKQYSEILAHIGMKLEVKYGNKLQVLCADNKKKIEQQLLVFSDLRAYAGYYSRLVGTQKTMSPDKYMAFANSLLGSDFPLVISPEQYAKSIALDKLSEFSKLNNQRNKSFARLIKKNLKSNPIVIIGGLHAKNLASELDNEKIRYNIINPKGYPLREDNIIPLIEAVLNQE